MVEAGAPNDPLIGTTLAARYEIVELIGTGAHSRVYKARQVSLDRMVAVKVLPGHLNFEKKRFEHEARVASLVQHANIVHVFDYGLLPQPYIVMELLPGQTLAQALKENGAMTSAAATDLLIEVCRGVQAAHDAGLIHRDLKPANVILSPDAAGKIQAKVVDFGLAKALGGTGQTLVQLTTTGQLLGTPSYMSPEQCTGRELDCRSDIYSLGCLMYEVLTGKLAFAADTAAACMYKHLQEMPPPITTVRPDLENGPLLEGMVLRALAKEPLERYQTVGDLKADLVALKDGKRGGFRYARLNYRAILSQWWRLQQRPKVRTATRVLVTVATAALFAWLNADNIANAIWQYQYQQGKVLMDENEYTKAKTKFTAALSSAEKFAPPCDWRLCRTLVQLRNAYKACGDMQTAKQIGDRARAMATGRRKEEAAAGNRAFRHGKYPEAERLMVAMIAKERQFPAERLAMAYDLEGLGRTYMYDGKYKEAEPVIKESLQLKKLYYDRDDSDLANALAQYADVCWQLNRIEEARELFEQSLAQMREQLGPGNPEYAWIVGMLGEVLREQRDMVGAEKAYKEAISLIDNSPHPENYDVSPWCGGLAGVYMATNRMALVEPLFLRQLAVKQKKFGQGHPDTCYPLKNLCDLRLQQNRIDEAIAYAKEALEIRTRALGEIHALTAESMLDYAKALRGKDPQQAAKLEARAKAIKSQLQH